MGLNPASPGTFVGHQMGQFVEEGPHDLAIPDPNERRVQLHEGIRPGGPPSCGAHLLVPTDPDFACEPMQAKTRKMTLSQQDKGRSRIRLGSGTGPSGIKHKRQLAAPHIASVPREPSRFKP